MKRKEFVGIISFFFLSRKSKRYSYLISILMSQYSNGWWWCETRQSRLLLIGTARVSFIHSFVSSHLGSGKSTTGIHLSFFFSFLYILFDSLCANAKEEWGKNSSPSFFFYSIRQKLLIIKIDLLSWSSIHSTTSFKKKRQVLITNHLSQTCPECECILSIYIWSCMRTFPLWIEKKKRKRTPEREYH
jgi:hypothetical protein